jgi:nucleoside-diphosphate-sugar epimerase
MARALYWGATRAADAGGSFLIVNTGAANANYQVKELADAVKEQVACDVHVNPNAQPDKRSYRVSFNKFAELAPEAQPVHEVTASIAALALQVGTVSEVAQYKRLAVLEELRAGGQLTSDLRWDRK